MLGVNPIDLMIKIRVKIWGELKVGIQVLLLITDLLKTTRVPQRNYDYNIFFIYAWIIKLDIFFIIGYFDSIRNGLLASHARISKENYRKKHCRVDLCTIILTLRRQI